MLPDKRDVRKLVSSAEEKVKMGNTIVSQMVGMAGQIIRFTFTDPGVEYALPHLFKDKIPTEYEVISQSAGTEGNVSVVQRGKTTWNKSQVFFVTNAPNNYVVIRLK